MSRLTSTWNLPLRIEYRLSRTEKTDNRLCSRRKPMRITLLDVLRSRVIDWLKRVIQSDLIDQNRQLPVISPPSLSPTCFVMLKLPPKCRPVQMN